MVQARASGDVGKSTIAVISVETRTRTCPLPPLIEGRAVDEEKIGVAVAVVVDPGNTAAAFGLDNVTLFRSAAREGEVDARWPGNLDE
jgi:hypothetical protein